MALYILIMGYLKENVCVLDFNYSKNAYLFGFARFKSSFK